MELIYNSGSSRLAVIYPDGSASARDLEIARLSSRFGISAKNAILRAINMPNFGWSKSRYLSIYFKVF